MEFRFASGWLTSSFAWFLLSVLLAGRALADPLPARDLLKFQQLPLTGANPNAPFYGHDETSTAYATVDPVSGSTGWEGTFMADDFADLSASPVVHVGWWGSYEEDFKGNFGVVDFLISFESDVPSGGVGGAPSHPGSPLMSQIVRKGPLAPNSGTFTETLVPSSGPGGTASLYHYNAELNLGGSFLEQPDTVYWLRIVALVDPNRDGNISWGWHDRDWSIPDPLASTAPAVIPGEGVVGSLASGGDVHHFQDDAVSGTFAMTSGLVLLQQSGFTAQQYLDGIDGPTGIGQFSKDLAFELYTVVPEPASAGLVALGVAGLALRKQIRSEPRERR